MASLREQLGFKGPLNSSKIMVNTLDELLSETPLYVCAKAVDKVTLNINGTSVNFEKNKEYVFPLQIFMSSRTHNGKTVFIPSDRSFPSRFRPYRGQNLDNSSLLVWRFGGLGDLIFTQPLIKYLKATYPTCKICFATAPKNIDLLRCWPRGLLDTGAAQPFQAQLLDDYDFHLTFEGAIERCKEAQTTNCYDIFQRVANVKFNMQDYYPELAVFTQIQDKIRPFIPPNTVAVQLRSSSPLRTYPLDKAADLVNALGDAGFVAGIIDSRDSTFGIQDMIMDRGVKDPSKFLNLSLLSATIPHCVAALDLCVGSIAVDSAIVHMSAALEKPVLGLYGAFTGDIRMKYYKNADWMEPEEGWNACSKRPCFSHGESSVACPYIQNEAYPGCLSSMAPEAIVERFRKVLRS
jgi:ADP-heptose:LPS heptosyltransferase